ncbi:hypothetical protein OG946_20145 [Streptomyces sp. NBC_01808]|uniref:phage tail protein n=1 Tax=Streptomyces sp. NBC_01808 TaxID=2975947 RepID=UPI002DD9D4DD|nr:hypothetical protein [Streptomyces sp. NBC_01808]WSA39467.1 hypothetical protein OG946_20145 [Streptomyces sp. NBC_01808]
MGSGLASAGESLMSVASGPLFKGAGAAAASAFIGAFAAIGTGLAGGLGVIGLSYALVKDEPKVKKAAGRLADTAKETFKSAAKPMVEPIADAVGDVEQTVKDLAPEIRRSFKIVADSGITENLTSGVDRMAKNMLPGFNSMLEDVQPVFEGFEELLADVGTGMGSFFESMGGAAPQTKQVLMDIGTLLKGILTWAGIYFGAMSRLYGVIRGFVVGVINVFKWLYGVVAGGSIPDLVNTVVRWLVSLPGRVLGALSGFAGAVAGRFTAMGGRVVSTTRGAVSDVVGFFRGLPGRAASAAGSLAGRIGKVATSAGVRFVGTIRRHGNNAIGFVRGLPGRASSAASALPGVLGTLAGRAGGRLVSGLRDKFADAVDVAERLPGRVRDGVGAVGSLLYEKGKDIARGLWNGIESMGGWLADKLGGWASSVVPGPIADALGIASPSKVTAAQGRWIARGLVVGLTGSRKQVAGAARRLADIVRDTLAPGRRRSGALDRIRRDTRDLTRLAARQAAVADRLARSEKRLSDLRRSRAQLSSTVRGAVMSGGEITGDSDAGPVTASAILSQLRGDAGAAEKFRRDLVRLRAAGVRGDLVSQLAQAGVDGGGAQAAALARATPAQIRQINQQQKLLKSAADRTGLVAGRAMYGSGIEAARGLVRGLRSQDRAIERQMLSIARAMRRSIRRALGIHSPSRVMARDVGRHIPAGLVRGIDSGRSAVEGAMSSLATVPTPTTAGTGSTRSAAGASPSAGGLVRVVIDVTGSDRDLVQMIKRRVRVDGGGVVQVALGTR